MAVNQTSLIGKGISRGAGNYFLFRSGHNYYSVPAYATDVSAMTPYDITTDLHAIDLSDSDGGVAGAPVRYVMF